MSPGRVAAFYATVIGAGLVVLSASNAWPLRLVFNASASAPLGWYGVDEDALVAIGDLAVVRSPARFEPFATERGYLAAGVPLLKVVAAGAGSRVCRTDGVVTINAAAVGEARERDRGGRPLPRWAGCRLLRAGEVFLFNRAAPDSLDGRYFGPTPAADIIGKATPLWTW